MTPQLAAVYLYLFPNLTSTMTCYLGTSMTFSFQPGLSEYSNQLSFPQQLVSAALREDIEYNFSGYVAVNQRQRRFKPDSCAFLKAHLQPSILFFAPLF